MAGLLAGDAASLAVEVAGPGRDTGGDASSRPILAVEFHDALADESIGEGVLVLVPSWRAFERSELRELLAKAAARRAAGVAVRGGAPAEIVAALGVDGAAPVPVLRVDDGVTWREFGAVVERAIGEHAPGIAAAVLQPDYLYAVADSIAEVFGGSVAVENHSRTLLAYSTVPGQLIDEFRAEGIRTRQVPEAVMNYEQYREMLRANGPVRFPRFGDELPRAAIAIRAGGLQLGSIWAIDPDGDDHEAPLDEPHREVLERGARSAAAHLLASWRASDADTRRRESALRRLLAGEAVAEALGALALSPNAELRLAALRFADGPAARAICGSCSPSPSASCGRGWRWRARRSTGASATSPSPTPRRHGCGVR